MGKIFMNEMVFFGYHGVMEEENRLGQNFIIDIHPNKINTYW